MTSYAMEVAKEAREKQLKHLEQFLSGEPTVFENHQGKPMELTYDPDDYTKDHSPRQVDFEPGPVFLSTAADTCITNEVSELEELIEEGADVNTPSAEGVTALHTACIEGSVKVASLLVKNGAFVDARDMDWWTPLHTAAACGQWRIARVLINNGADLRAVTADGELAVDLADEAKVRNLLLDEMDKAGISEAEHEELKKKPEKDFLDYVSSVIEKGGDINEPDADGATLLHVAACNGWMEPLKLLTAKGADVNAQDVEMNTPLHCAAFFLQYHAVNELAKAKADPHKKNRHKEPPVHMTEDRAMIRTIKAMESTAPDAKPQPAHGMRPRATSTVKRKTFSRADIKKVEAKQEAKLAESMYAEIQFSEKPRRESEWAERDKRVHYDPVIYASLEFAESPEKPPAPPLSESVASEAPGAGNSKSKSTSSSSSSSNSSSNSTSNSTSASHGKGKQNSKDEGQKESKGKGSAQADTVTASEANAEADASISMDGGAKSNAKAGKGCCNLL